MSTAKSGVWLHHAVRLFFIRLSVTGFLNTANLSPIIHLWHYYTNLNPVANINLQHRAAYSNHSAVGEKNKTVFERVEMIKSLYKCLFISISV